MIGGASLFVVIRGRVWDEEGQSLVELALMLPILLLILLALADFGRAFYYTTAIANAAREGAAYLSQNPSATGAAVSSKVCNETGFVPYSPTATCPGLTVTFAPNPYAPGADVVVTATYDFRLVSSYLVSRVFASDPVRLRAQATYPGLR